MPAPFPGVGFITERGGNKLTLNVLDVSNYQATLSANVIAQSEEILIVKATQGTGYTNPSMSSQVEIARAQGKLVGLYHFPEYGEAVDQVNYFYEQTKDYWGKGWAIPILDWENGPSSGAILDYPDFAVDWLTQVSVKTGASPWLYTGIEGLNKGNGVFKSYPIWFAAYPYSTPNYGFSLPVAWSWARDTIGGGLAGYTVIGWQFTGTGRLDGYAGDLDMSIFFADRAELASYTGAATGSSASATGETVFLQPVSGFAVTQNFGDGAELVVDGVKTNVGKGHTGIDFGCPVGTETVALEAGTVLWADWAKNLPTTSWEDRWYIVGGGYRGMSTDAGTCLVIDHGSYLSTYSHLSETALEPGDKVRQGQVVGKTGATGFVSGAHLHFEVLPKPLDYQNGYFGRVNPVPYFTQTLDSDSLLTQKDGFDMANIEDVFTTKRAAWGGRNLDEVIKELDRNTWNTKKMTWRLDSLFRIGVPGRFTDGVLGGMLRKLSSYNEGTQGKARQAEYDAASKNNFDA